jgi:hypothetical protein
VPFTCSDPVRVVDSTLTPGAAMSGLTVPLWPGPRDEKAAISPSMSNAPTA